MTQQPEQKRSELPAIRWDAVNTVYEKLDNVFCEEVNKNQLTFVEIENVLSLMRLKVLKSEIKHLVGLSIGDIFKDRKCGGACEKGEGCHT